MFTRINKTLSQLVLIALLPLCFSAYSATYAQTEPTKAQRQVISERHKSMAEIHTKMVTCLNSDKMFAQCQKEMTESCANSFAGNCPMMGRGKMGGRGKEMMNGTGYWDWMMNPNAEIPASSPNTSK
jgi:hypothetical protein